MVYCTACSREQPDITRFCRYCGERLPGPEMMERLRADAQRIAAERMQARLGGATPSAAAATPRGGPTPAAARAPVSEASLDLDLDDPGPTDRQPSAAEMVAEAKRKAHAEAQRDASRQATGNLRSIMHSMDED